LIYIIYKCKLCGYVTKGVFKVYKNQDLIIGWVIETVVEIIKHFEEKHPTIKAIHEATEVVILEV